MSPFFSLLCFLKKPTSVRDILGASLTRANADSFVHRSLQLNPYGLQIFGLCMASLHESALSEAKPGLLHVFFQRKICTLKGARRDARAVTLTRGFTARIWRTESTP